MSTAVNLLDWSVINSDYLPLYKFVVNETGEHAQVLGAMIFLSGAQQHYETFASLSKIASIALVSPRSAQRSLERLQDHGLIQRRGREQAFGRRGPVRRTVTYRLGKTTIELVKSRSERFFMLPRPIVGAYRKFGQPLKWSERILLSVIVSRHSLVENPIIEGCADDRKFHTLKTLHADTGLTRASIIEGRRGLGRRKLIVATAEHHDDGRPRGYWLQLNEGFNFNSDFLPDGAYVELQRSSKGTVQPRKPPLVKPPACVPVDDVTPLNFTAKNVSIGDGSNVTTTQFKSDHDLVQMCPGGGSNVTIAIKQSSLPKVLTNVPKQSVRTNHHQQAGDAVGVSFQEGQGEKPKHRMTPEEQQAKLQAELAKLAKLEEV